MYHVFFIHSSIEGHLDCSQVLVITNKAAVDIVEQMSGGMIEHPFVLCLRMVSLGLEVN